LFDVAEYALPELRVAYMSAHELVGYRDADRYSQRSRDDADRLNERGAASRWQGHGIDDVEVRRISSFLQSYNEMRKGGRVLKREIRGRARSHALDRGADNDTSGACPHAVAQNALAGDAAKSVAVPNLTFAGVASRDTSMRAG